MTQKNQQQYILFDIDSSSIGAVVFEVFFDTKLKKQKYKTIFSIRDLIAVNVDADADDFLKRTLSVFNDVAVKTHKYSGDAIAGIYLNVSAPWTSSQKRIVHFEKDAEFIFTKEIADSIIAGEILEPLHHTHDFKDYKNLDLVERKTIDFFENGYPTKKPYGKKIKDVDIHSLITVMSTDVKKDFIHVIERNFHIEDVEFISNVFMSYQSLLSTYPDENNIVHFDLSSEVTEIVIIINDHLQSLGTIPVGSRYITKTLADILQIPFVKTESLIVMYQQNNLDEKYKNNIESAMKKAFLAWFKHFYNFLDTVSLEHIVPSTLSVVAPKFLQHWLTEWILKTDDMTEHMHAHKKISILNIHSTLADDIVDDASLSLCLQFLKKFNYIEDSK